MRSTLRVLLAMFAVYRFASLISSEEGPYLGFYKPKGMGFFEWMRMRLGVYDYGPDGKPETNLARGISCPLCTGVYTSLCMSLLALFPTRVGDFFLMWLGLAGAQVFFENLTSDEAIQEAIEDVAGSLEEPNVA